MNAEEEFFPKQTLHHFSKEAEAATLEVGRRGAGSYGAGKDRIRNCAFLLMVPVFSVCKATLYSVLVCVLTMCSILCVCAENGLH